MKQTTNSCLDESDIEPLLADQDQVEECEQCQALVERMCGEPSDSMFIGESDVDEAISEQFLVRLKQLAPWSDSDAPDTAKAQITVSEKNAPQNIDRSWPVIAGYEISEELGRGGMGTVYKARQVALKRTVALKVLSNTNLAADRLARFRSEAEIEARVQHPNLLQVYDVGEYDGQPYIAREYIEGCNLAQHVYLLGRSASRGALIVGRGAIRPVLR